MKDNVNIVLAHITCDLANIKEKLFGRGLIKYCSRITVFMTKDLMIYLWKYTRGELAIAKMPDEMQFYGYPVKRIDEDGMKYWISVENGEFHKEDLEEND